MPQSTQTNITEKPNLLDVVTWICAAVSFFPFAVWLFDEVSRSRQLSDALLIFACICVAVAMDATVRLHKPKLGRRPLAFLGLAYAAVLISPYCETASMPLGLAGLSLFLMAAGFACIDKPRFVFAAGVAFYAFLMLSLFISAFDMPLRALAGNISVGILKLVNPSAMLVSLPGYPPQIGMIVNSKTYLVAAECNGFGLISSCAVLSVFFATLSKAPIRGRLLLVILGILAAVVANALRIVAIVTLAPHFRKEHYMVVHEACGYFFFALALLAVWKMGRAKIGLAGRPQPPSGG